MPIRPENMEIRLARSRCRICRRAISPERRRLFPTTITCQRVCAREYRKELSRRTSRRHYRRKHSRPGGLGGI